MEQKRNTLIVNCFAGPGAGKTTCAWEIAAELKKKNIVTEYVPEYAKELVWDNNLMLLDGTAEHQTTLFKEQNHRIQRLIGKVDVVVTDSPILLGTMYCEESTEAARGYRQTVLEQHNAYNNFNLFINRGKTFETEGRIHTLEESKKIDSGIKQFLDSNNIYYGNYYHQTIGVLIDNIQKTLHRISNKKVPEKEEPVKPERKSLRGIPVHSSRTLKR